MTSDSEWIRKKMESAIWSVFYHERELTEAHQQLAAAKSFLARVGIVISDTDLRKYVNERDPDETCRDADEMALSMMARALSSCQYHEDALSSSHVEKATITALLKRGGYTSDEVNVAKIEKEQKERVNKDRTA